MAVRALIGDFNMHSPKSKLHFRLKGEGSAIEFPVRRARLFAACAFNPQPA